ncbi:hypothetical protein [Gimesia chilikensis]|uniref:hypothetical protein n=1 Tax=Gimesia chilikensis TaxID=2605989 RepID=UPI003A92CE30
MTKKLISLYDYFMRNKEKAILIIEKFEGFREKFEDKVLHNLELLDDNSKKLLSTVNFELIESETISLQWLKGCIQEKGQKIDGFKKVAFLKLGYNNKSNKHEFAMQFLDENNVSVEGSEMIIVQGKTVDDNLHEAFGENELIVLK